MAESSGSSLLTRKDWRILVIAIALGIIGVVLLNLYISSKNKQEELVSVAVATQPIPGGTLIKRGMLAEKKIPKSAIGGRFLKGADIASVEGRAMNVDLEQDQPAYWGFVTVALEQGMDRWLRPENSERAFAMSFPGQASEAVKSGDVIDIYGTYSRGSGDAQAFEILPAVTVGDRIGSTLWLCVTPDEALLLLAAQPCSPIFVVRSKKETKSDVRLKAVKLSDVLPKAQELGRVREERVSAQSGAAWPSPGPSITPVKRKGN